MFFNNFRDATRQDHLGFELSKTALVANFSVTNVAGFIGRLSMSAADGSVDASLRHFHNCDQCVVLLEQQFTTVIFFGEDGVSSSMTKEADADGFYDGHYDSHELACSLDCLESIDVEALISRGFNGPFLI